MKIFQIGVNDQVKTAIKFSKHFTHTYTLNLEEVQCNLALRTTAFLI